MFDNEINFLPQGKKSRMADSKKGSKPFVKPNIAYTKTEEPFQEEQEVQEKIEKQLDPKNKGVFSISSKSIAPISAVKLVSVRDSKNLKKLNFFKKISVFVNKILKSKKKETLIDKPGKPLEKPVIPDHIELAPIKPAQAKPEPIIEEISKVSSIIPPEKEIQPQPDKEKIIPLPKKSSSFTVPSLSKIDQPKEAGVNLMPENIAVDVSFKNKIFIMIGGIIFAGVIIGLSFLGIRLYSRSFVNDSTDTQNELLDIEKEIKVYEKYRRESNVLAEQIGLTLDLVKAHKHWSKLFPAIEFITHADVLYSEFIGDISGQINLSSSAPNFKVLAQQILMLKDNGEIIEDFDVSDIGIFSKIGLDDPADSDTKVAFSLTLKFNPDFFLASEINTQK